MGFNKENTDGHLCEVEDVDEPVVVEPGHDERISALEKAMLDMIMGGVSSG